MLVILNTASGALRDEAARARLRSLLPDATFVEIERDAEIDGAIAREPAEVVVAAGGDGTLSAVAGRLAGTGRALGVIAGGTLNHFARDLRIPVEFEAAAALLRARPIREIDVGEVNGRVFINNSSLGMYPQIVRQREKIRRRGVRKWIAFALAVARVIARWRPLSVRIDVEGRARRRLTPFVFVGNNRYDLEGLRMGSRDRLDAGELCLCVARRMSRWSIARMMTRGLLGGLRDSGDLEVRCVRELWIATRRWLDVALDGEVLRMRGPLHYIVRPRALRVIAP